jgi:hypothetical protein
MLGAAETTGSRRSTGATLAAALTRRGRFHGSREVLTPLAADPLALIPLLVVASQVPARPRRARALATAAVRDYSVPAAAVEAVRP